MTAQNTSIAGSAQTAASENAEHTIADEYGTTPLEGASSWWHHPTIEAIRWNQSFPYQLLVVEAQEGGAYRVHKGWRFTLPIPPESLSVTTPFAISTSVTLGGIVEEHNAAPIRQISLSGTTGVFPLRGLADQTQINPLANAILGGTISNAQRVGTAAASLANVRITKNNLVSTATAPDSIAMSTGYYQFKLLERFLESYAELKKKGNPNLRLAFAMWKDQQVYLVTPQSFSMQRQAATPLEYHYQLMLKAWRRIILNGPTVRANVGYRPVVASPNALSIVKNAIRDARRVLHAVRDTMQSVITDVDGALFEPLRQVACFVKDTLGVALTLNDLPTNIILASKPAVIEWASLGDTFSAFGNTFADHSRTNQERFRDLVEAMNVSSKGETKGGALSKNDLLSVSPVNQLFENPQDNLEFFENIRVGDLNLSTEVLRQVSAERVKVKGLTRLDFERMRDSIDAVAASYADAVGAGDATYNATFNLPERVTTKTPTSRDFEVLFALNRVSIELSRLAASGTINEREVSTMEVMAGLARRSGIAFEVPRSKFSVPLPYGHTLEKVSQMYLGTPDRWEEIAALNGLRTPYIDEVGFDLALLVNGVGNTVVVADSSNLYIGQQVWISAPNTARAVRRITKIEQLSTTQSIITVDGDPDLSRFTTSNSALLHAFLPDTVNSQMMIYIPSDVEATGEDFQTKSIPGVDQFDRLLAVGGVDLLLTQENDLAITPDGDCRLAVGLTNIIQSVRLRLSCPRGGLLGHPEYGFPLQPGMSVADIEARDIAKILEDLFSDDPVFTGVYGVSVKVQGPVVPITMAVGIQGVSDKIPITVNVRR